MNGEYIAPGYGVPAKPSTAAIGKMARTMSVSEVRNSRYGALNNTFIKKIY